MPNIHHEFPVTGSRQHVFEAITRPGGLNAWWTLRASGIPEKSARYTFDFGPGYVWTGIVVACEAPDHIEWRFVDASPDWVDTRLSFTLEESNGTTTVRFAHTRWRAATQHYRVTSFCWAMYLRHLKRYVEIGCIIPYGARLDD